MHSQAAQRKNLVTLCMDSLITRNNFKQLVRHCLSICIYRTSSRGATKVATETAARKFCAFALSLRLYGCLCHQWHHTEATSKRLARTADWKSCCWRINRRMNGEGNLPIEFANKMVKHFGTRVEGLFIITLFIEWKMANYGH